MRNEEEEKTREKKSNNLSNIKQLYLRARDRALCRSLGEKGPQGPEILVVIYRLLALNGAELLFYKKLLTLNCHVIVILYKLLALICAKIIIIHKLLTLNLAKLLAYTNY